MIDAQKHLEQLQSAHVAACDMWEMAQDQGFAQKHLDRLRDDCLRAHELVEAAKQELAEAKRDRRLWDRDARA
jgi:hypothetical protein